MKTALFGAACVAWLVMGLEACNLGPECEGFAVTCSDLSLSACETQSGCYFEGECSGAASWCMDFQGSWCDNQDGCHWDDFTHFCAGSATSCYHFSNSSDCLSQDGCDWTDMCAGGAERCSEQTSESACYAHSGCSWK